MQARITAAAFFLAVFVCGVSPVFAIAGTDRVADKGQKAEALPGWPLGVLEIINDPVRTTGWLPWFSELPNDMRYYILQAEMPEDIQRLVRGLAAIKAPSVEIVLDPGKGASHAENAPATFSIGDQAQLDGWYARLPVKANGERTFGVHTYKEKPTATAPTLTLYVGHAAVDLAKLDVPANVKVTTHARTTDEAHKAGWAEIDDFLAKRKEQK